ncbi:Tah18p [Sugiyamaella lignohabitans]|uniref:NADPH-dependent diflavin oxidoreductase 1 n=1 Tax=Sugiyamaella lignohabitans TaxID=796027 RepID=A0A167F185_9ASCO|nr:Tah18p [Sugiyamaella lignohabitans]ANB14694.1 Tah18p [Sugiyamaella lignohabitans]
MDSIVGSVSPQRSVLILYGTETGNAQDCAEILAKKCQRLRLNPTVCGMDDYDVSQLPLESTIIVICSTTGQGDLPRNALKFWRFLLRKKLPPTLLSHIRFTSFGLGDSSYPRYNWAIRKVHKRLMQLGAREFIGRGEGDEMGTESLDSQFESWIDLISERLLQPDMFPLAPGTEVISDNILLEPRYKLSVDTKKIRRLTSGEAQTATIALTRGDALVGTVVSNKRITAQEHFQDVRNFEFTASQEDSTPSLDYLPGDTVGLYPRNDATDVNELLEHQGWSEIADHPVTVNEEFEKAIIGGLVKPLTLRSLITHHLDISAIPRRSFFAVAWHFSTDNEREQERLKEFSTIEGLQDLYDYANRSRRSILETITEFYSLKIPVEYILDLIPILRPRLFSISSPSPGSFRAVNDGVQTSDNEKPSDPVNKTSFSLTIAIVKYKTIIKRIRRGVCTKWVEGLTEGDKIPFSLFRASFKSEDVHDIETPIIMIAPGTGIAPMRSLILTRAAKEAVLQPDTAASMLLFFGCRYKEKDYLYEDDWNRVSNSGHSSLTVIPAFSRENGGYVQDKLYSAKDQVSELLVKQNASIYVCGSAGKMPRQVRITIATILEETQNWSTETTEAYVSSMERTGRYLQETW